MNGRIPQNFIDEVLARTDIVELVDARVPLKKKGRNFSACCPFHNEKTPSFSVSQDKQFYHCFGCGASGNAISFLMEYDRLEFLDALDELAGRLGLEIPREAGSQPQKGVKDLYDLMSDVSLFYQKQLRSDAGNKAKDYLKDRGLSGEVALAFGLGYAPDSWDALIKALGGTDKIKQQLIDTGMLIKNDKGRIYDRFRDRVMFPIRDKRGKVIAFGGRIIGQGEPKYLNSPETTIFHKGRELYGLFEARQANQKLTNILIVEGYMDVVALAQHGVTNAVATLGTATSEYHLQQLFRVVNELVFCFDGDRAGRAAAWRALETSLPLIKGERSVRFMFLPDGEDPDSLIRQVGEEGFRDQQKAALALSEFMFDQLSEDLDIASPDGKRQYAARIKPLLEKITDGVYRALLLKSLAERITLPEQQLSALMGFGEAPRQTSSAPQASNKMKPKHSATRGITPMRMAIGLLLQHPKLAEEVADYHWLDEVQQPGAPLLRAMLELLHNSPHLTMGALMEHWRDTETHSQLNKLAGWDHMVGDDELVDVFCDSIERLFTELRKARLQELIEGQKAGSLNSEEIEELKALLSHSS